ncbi:MAG: glycosyltransferase [Chloroflexi bacterium]|nr:glycosyltransferase [Chloroflexota bacterium]
MTRISLCLIAKNEAANLRRLFDSARGAADEIVLVDTGSADGTVALAQTLGAIVHRFEWRDDFAAAKNAAIARASGEWALMLDADMEVAAGGAEKIRRAAESGSAGSYYLNIHSPRADGVTTEIISQPWLFKRAPGVEFIGRVHEDILPSLIARKMPPQMTDIVVMHFGYMTDAAMAARGERDMRILESQADPNDTLSQYYLARAYVRVGRKMEALKKLVWVITSPSAERRMKANAHTMLINLSPGLESREATLRRVEDATRAFPGDRMIWSAAANVYVQLDRVELAVPAMERALGLPRQSAAEGAVLDRSDEHLRLQLAECLTYLGRLPEALNHFHRVLDDGLRTPDVYCSFGLAHSLMGNHAEAEMAFDTALGIDPSHADAHRQLGFLCAETNRPAQALTHFNIAVAAGHNDPDLLQAIRYVKAQTQTSQNGHA